MTTSERIKSLQQRVAKFNPHHDTQGQFSSGGGGGASFGVRGGSGAGKIGGEIAGGHRGRAMEVRREAKDAGFRHKATQEQGSGTATQSIANFEHSSGHKLRLSTGPGREENFWELKDKHGGTVSEGKLPGTVSEARRLGSILRNAVK